MAYTLLCAYGREGESPTLEQMAEDLGVSSKAFRGYLREVEAYGLIQIRRQGLNLPNEYTILPLSEVMLRKRGQRNERTKSY